MKMKLILFVAETFTVAVAWTNSAKTFTKLTKKYLS